MKNFIAVILLSLLASIAFAARQEQAASVKPEGDWKGTIDAGGTKLDLILHISRKDGALSATLDSPDQGATALTIDSISLNGNSLRFQMNGLGADYQGVFSADGSQIEGQFSQQGQRLQLTFKRIGKSDSSESILKLQKVDVGGHSLQLLVG